MVQVYRGDALTDGSFLKAFKEEQQLKEYFNSEKVAEEFLPYQDLFQ